VSLFSTYELQGNKVKYFEIIYTTSGKKGKVVLQSSNRIGAIQLFKSKKLGIFTKIKEIDEPFEFKFKKLKEQFFGLSNSRVSIEPYIASLRQLAVMLDAGLPINQCLFEVLESIEDRRLHIIFTSILADIEGGLGLTKASSPFTKQLGDITISMFELGEQTGELPKSISQLAEILQEIHDNRKKLKKATRYPITIIIFMGIAFGVVIKMVVPEFESIFADSNTELPLPTRFLIGAKDFIDAYALLIIVGIVIALFINKWLYVNNEEYRYGMDKGLLKIYLIGDVIYFAMVGRFIYIFDTLSDAGIPIIDSLNTSIGIVENVYIKERLNLIITSIEDGKSITQGFKDSQQFENMITQMVDAGERSGAINKMLNKIAIYYKDKYQYIIDNVSILMEPILLALIACFVLMLALGIFLPMWSLADAVS